MSPLDKLQTSFLDYLSGKNIMIEELVVNQGLISAKTRLDIYKNAYYLRLKEALETDHEWLGIYLGDELFDEMVDGYVQSHPSHYTSLRYFGESLPDYLAITKPFSQHPILTEIARFERRLMDVFDAADAKRLDFSALQETPTQSWPTLRFRFHPSVQLLNTDWNSIESWKALKNQQPPPTASNSSTKHWMLWRGTEQLSEFRPVNEDEYRFLEMAIHGECFALLCETLLPWHQETDIGEISIEYLRRWFDQGMVIALDT